MPFGKQFAGTLIASLTLMGLAVAHASNDTSGNAGAPAMTAAEKEVAKKIYFERCAGCHGVLRKGATGKNLEPHWEKTQEDGNKLEGGTLSLGTKRLEKIITYGTEGGMVNYDDILTKEEINLMARYIQNPPDVPPEFSLKDMKDSWKLIVPVAERPKKQMNKVNLKNVFAITLRDAGKLALIDGDTHKVWKILDTGYAVHISRLSASGRYVYTVGRDGLTTIIDMWYAEPTTVATVRLGSDARSVDVSKFKGYEDKYLIGGTYWPPQYSIMDGETLEPIKIVSTRGQTIDGEYHPEPRVASIVASSEKPEWVVNVKETGQIMLVDYTDLKNLKTTTIESSKFLHDGGWDASKRYFMVAANASNQVAAVDTKEGKLAAIIDTAKIPHPGRGANLFHPEFGPVWATGHLGAAVVSLISTASDDPKNARFKQYNWKVVQELKMPGAGNLFVKTHPKSKHFWADAPMNPEREIAEGVYVFDKDNLSKDPVRLDVAKDSGLPETKAIRRAVQPEYNVAGDEVWISLWGGKADQSAIVVYDDKTLKLKQVITSPEIVTPTGKFNVFNTMHDVY
ncbi:cytochrome D1 domain-containing protein [Pseudomonas schmalbachii]|uniref:C-type cytochrome n=1 Tax=Pseudomonas schmalbachii TaxID=2816993 RepID=A0ABS3TZ31_9PSED|nr:cytochrome D1 domain-containing protein [Pseudomonas schmalbachii]MBO3277935.1 c-type cytochrome [Pseudomonas schmalbachii]